MTPQPPVENPPGGAPNCPDLPLLRGQSALVTGASSGIGRSIALAMAAAGANVVVNYSSSEQSAEEVCAEIAERGGRAVAVHADVSNEAEVEQLFAKAMDEFGRLDILVNNAGLQQDAAFDEMTLAEWNKVIGVNLTGHFLCARTAVRLFKQHPIRPEISCAAGKIIFISSVHEVIPWAGHANYAASKGGVMLLMKTLAQEVAPLRIRVNSISPGAIRTPINEDAWSTAEAYRHLLKLIPYKRIGEPAEIGRAAVWLASDYADYIHGTSLFVDGGMSLYPGFEAGG